MSINAFLSLTVPATISLSNFRQITVETECGFVIGRTIDRPIPDARTLRHHIASVHPTIEVGDKALTPEATVNGRDFIAANVSASHVIYGATVNATSIDLNALEPTLSLDGTVISHGRGTDDLGDQ